MLHRTKKDIDRLLAAQQRRAAGECGQSHNVVEHRRFVYDKYAILHSSMPMPAPIGSGLGQFA